MRSAGADSLVTAVCLIIYIIYSHKRSSDRWRWHRLLSVVVPLLALCSCEVFAGVGGVFSVGVSCVRVPCWLFYIDVLEVFDTSELFVLWMLCLQYIETHKVDSRRCAAPAPFLSSQRYACLYILNNHINVLEVFGTSELFVLCMLCLKHLEKNIRLTRGDAQPQLGFICYIGILKYINKYI